jgi:hypothetical protein
MIYLVVWVLLFAAPLLSLYVRTVNDTDILFDWTEVFLVWRKFAVFLLLFLVHNFLLAPLLVHKQKRVLYLSFVAVVFVGFTVYQCNSRPDIKGRRGHHPPFSVEGQGHRPPPEFDGHAQFENPSPRKFRPDGPPPIVGERDILAVVVLILMFGANLGTKYYFRSRGDQKRLAELEKQNLEQQLEYLRYQINPHFFMNTLNNIHALVDIDPTKAQETILELSKMMRFLLYEGNKNGVPLSREFEFLRTYVKLMQLRYTDKVRITLELRTANSSLSSQLELPDKTIPPLILISFVENAFKHGVSYQRESFIEVKAEVQADRLSFSCRNSKVSNPEEESGKKGGVGLTNIRKRLNLLYDNDYTLNIQDTPDIYSVELVIPLNVKL